MKISEVILILSFLLGGGGLLAFVMNLRKEIRDQGKTKRERIIEEELIEEKGAGLLVTTSSEAIAVFKVALETANEEAKRFRKERDEERLEKIEMASRIRDLEGRVRYLEAEVRGLQGDDPRP